MGVIVGIGFIVVGLLFVRLVGWVEVSGLDIAA